MTSQQPGNRLAGRTALVTGSTRGLGRTIAEWLAREGADVIVTGRDERDVQESIEAIRGLGVDSFGAAADLSQLSQIHGLASAIFERIDQLDILVNNAGMSIIEDCWDVSDEHWDYQMNVNLRAPYILSQYAIQHMIEQKIPGRIVNISTIGAHRTHGDRAVYNIGKAGVEMMTSAMAFEVAAHGITINCVAPGAMAERPGQELSPEERDRIARGIPVGRVGTGDDIASAVTYFCLPESSFITGETLLVTGGHESKLWEPN
ncbi:MAG: SDR family oxidoreductase [Sphaerobacteraceae bacterium]|nr:MAG: SDR family oxidoreductase [Sphaerobacteraceae bacterium]